MRSDRVVPYLDLDRPVRGDAQLRAALLLGVLFFLEGFGVGTINPDPLRDGHSAFSKEQEHSDCMMMAMSPCIYIDMEKNLFIDQQQETTYVEPLDDGVQIVRRLLLLLLLPLPFLLLPGTVPAIFKRL